MLTPKAKTILNEIADVLDKHDATLDVRGSLDVRIYGEPDVTVHEHSDDPRGWVEIQPRTLRALAKPFTEKDAYEMGLKDGRSAAARGEVLSSGMSWLHDQDFNEAYDAGVNAAQKAFVREHYPDAYPLFLDFGSWQIWGGVGDEFPAPLAEGETEYEAWQDATLALSAKTPTCVNCKQQVTATGVDLPLKGLHYWSCYCAIR